MLYFSVVLLACYLPFLAFCNAVLDKYLWNFVSCSQMCVVILNLPESIIKSNCLLLAVPRDSPNCKKHNEENTSFGREYDVRMRSSTRRNLVRTSNSRRNLGRVNFRKDFWDCYKGEGKNDQKWPRWRACPHLSNNPRKNCGKYFGANRFKRGEWTCCAQRPRKGVNGRRLVATIGIGLSIENLKTDTFELHSVYDFHEM